LQKNPKYAKIVKRLQRGVRAMRESFTILFQRHFGPGMLIGGGLLLILVFFATVSCKDLRFSIYIFLLSIVFTSLANPVLYVAAYALRWLILVFILGRMISGKSRITISKVGILFGLWTVVAIMSAFQAPSIFRGLVFGVIYFLCFVVFFLLMLGEITTEEHMQDWFKMFSYLAWTFVLLSVVVFVIDPSARGGQGRFIGIFRTPMTLSRVLVIAGTIFLWHSLRHYNRRLPALIYFGIVAVCSFLILLAGSRGALGGFAVTLAIFALHYRKKMALLVIPALIIGGFYIVPKVLYTSSKEYVRHITTLESNVRIRLREQGIQRFLERPILGWGIGSLSDIHSPVVPRYQSFHNSFLNFLTEFGLPGFLVVMTVLVYTYLRIWRLALFDSQTEYIRDVAWFIAANLTTLFLWNYWDGALSNPSQIHFYWLLVLIVLTQCLFQINEEVKNDIFEDYPEEINQKPAVDASMV